MKYQRHNNTSSLFLLELILAVLFFSVASALCIQIFTKAHLMSQDARDLNFAVNEVSSMAEQISAGTLHPDTAASSDDTASDPSTQISNDAWQDDTAYYDSSYASCEKADAVYVLTVHYEPEDTLLKAHISMDTIADNRNIYTLDVTNHLQRRAES
ncbi:hypothetical protein NIA28_07010 [Coprococcus catus]|uniref:hypothetical protein n=1 Tax=Coprococcus catus TaxID=116085 RepID=UPI002097217B|nr:hypothetical protein [Coprococcus catus]MCO7146144.1 hypothetical protein [Coprococcus catus]